MSNQLSKSRRSALRAGLVLSLAGTLALTAAPVPARERSGAGSRNSERIDLGVGGFHKQQRATLRNKLMDLKGSYAGSGVASVYSGGKTASGEYMSSGALTAAHPSLPFGTRVTVTNSRTGKSVVVRINDRGPFVHGRIIDLSPAAARAIGAGDIANVSLRVGG
jgi:rare lipoprotein A